MKPSPWLIVQPMPVDGRDGLDVHIGCAYCPAHLVIEAPAAMPTGEIVKRAAVFEHAGDCIVPARLAKAHAARWN